MSLGCGATSCHGSKGVSPANNTISGFCATCHGNFHTLSTGDSDGIGANISSPFIRHPNDIVLPSRGEYQNYTNYNVEAPVGRTTEQRGDPGYRCGDLSLLSHGPCQPLSGHAAVGL
jgi:hypothetical protein